VDTGPSTPPRIASVTHHRQRRRHGHRHFSVNRAYHKTQRHLRVCTTARLLTQRGLSVNIPAPGFFRRRHPVASPRTVEEWSRQHNITYLGHTDNVTRYIEQADASSSLLPGRHAQPCWKEPACVKPDATDTAGCREVIRDGVNGYLCRKETARPADKMEILPADSGGKKTEWASKDATGSPIFHKEIVSGSTWIKLNRLSRNPSLPS